MSKQFKVDTKLLSSKYVKTTSGVYEHSLVQDIVLSYLAHCLHKKESYSESYESMAKSLGMSRKSVIESVKFWVGAGVVVAEKVAAEGRGSVMWSYKSVNKFECLKENKVV